MTNRIGSQGIINRGSLTLSVFDGVSEVRTIDLFSFGKNRISFGRAPDNDVILNSRFISRHHGYFVESGGRWIICDNSSKNGLILDGIRVGSATLEDGVSVRVDNPDNPLERSVVFLVTSGSGTAWNSLPLDGRDQITIGRSKQNDICLSHVGVSRLHARIIRHEDGFYIYDYSTNGISVNNRMVNRRLLLREKDIIIITNTKLIFTNNRISYQHTKTGISLDALDIVKTVKVKGVRKDITDHVSLSIKPGELVAIVGGSGAGKTTFMNCISGYNRATSGTVLVNGQDLYSNYEAMKSIIGYVPQQDIVHDNLTLSSMLGFAAKLRMPADTSPQERQAMVSKVIETVELDGHGDTFIRQLSGGQKKRASIAVELLSEPNLFFLDEPTSGLDPGTERNLMNTLKRMTTEGRTVILITHNTMNLHLCDRLIILGRGGRLCFCGNPGDAQRFFGVSSFVDIYPMLDKSSEEWSRRFQSAGFDAQAQNNQGAAGDSYRSKKKTPPFFTQLLVLCARYTRIIINDRQRLFLLIAQSVLLSVLIYLVSNGSQYEQYNITKAIMFALACSSFWIGILNAIQEICKEFAVLRREAAAALSLSAYVISKFVVLGLMCLVQALILSGGFALLVGLPDEGVSLPPFLEIMGTTYLCMLSAMGLGLCVSAVFKNPDRAMTVAPILLMPQILFSGLAFELTGAVEKISIVVSCRWAVEGYGTSSNLNALPLALQEEFPMVEHAAEDFFEYTPEHFFNSWIVMAFMAICFAAACIILIRCSLKSGKE